MQNISAPLEISCQTVVTLPVVLHGQLSHQLLFSLCMLPLGNPMRQQSTNHRSYAADTCYMLDDNSLIALFPTDINKRTSTF